MGCTREWGGRREEMQGLGHCPRVEELDTIDVCEVAAVRATLAPVIVLPFHVNWRLMVLALGSV